ncbi:MAG: hypothetical protein AAGF26_01355 [Cyanobacteria bacterium P01_G01_bin.49]
MELIHKLKNRKLVLNKLRREFERLIKSGGIAQFSPPRSGSTLIYNVLREVFPEKFVEKGHVYSKINSKYPIVVTYRHPLDSIASSIQRYGLPLTDKVIEEQILELDSNGVWDVLNLKGKPNVLMLRYEDFSNNFNFIYSELESFFGIEISQEKKELIKDKYKIEAVERMIESKESFDDFDPVTHLHGKHISKYKGQPGYYLNFFKSSQVDYLEDIYRKYLLELNYI